MAVTSTGTAIPESSAEIQERLDGLPWSRRHTRLLFGSGLGWALDAMDVGLVSFVVAALVQHGFATAEERPLILSIGFAGMAIGAAVGGLLADRLGRRSVFAITLLIFGVATGLTALSWSVGALLVFRFIAGLGLGAELPVASTYLSEFAPRRIRGRVIVLLEAFWAIGWFLQAIVGATIVPLGPDAWRWALLIGAAPAVYAAVVRFGMPESVRYLLARGRREEADLVVRGFAAAAWIRRDSALALRHRPGAALVDTGPTEAGLTFWRRVAGLWAPGLRRSTSGLWLLWFFVNFAYYGAFLWIPSILVADGYPLATSFVFTLVITAAQLPGYLVAAWLIERWGRRLVLVVFLLGSAVSAVCFGTMPGEAAILGFGSALSFFNLGAWGAVYAITPESYPTSVRATGSGWAAGVGRIASIIVPFLVAPLLAAGGRVTIFVMFTAAFVVAAGAALLIRERRGAALE
ncbi:MAG: MFS transporter [Microbacteriaceae bacterium]|nr:MFS transporter [Microbacteriaceae bacterium]